MPVINIAIEIATAGISVKAISRCFTEKPFLPILPPHNEIKVKRYIAIILYRFFGTLFSKIFGKAIFFTFFVIFSMGGLKKKQKFL
jgi:hypothetical protein